MINFDNFIQKFNNPIGRVFGAKTSDKDLPDYMHYCVQRSPLIQNNLFLELALATALTDFGRFMASAWDW